MKDRTLSLHQLFFIVGTRALLASGVALLASRKMKDRTRLRAGTALLAIGAITTIPAVLLVIRSGHEDTNPEPEPDAQ